MHPVKDRNEFSISTNEQLCVDDDKNEEAFNEKGDFGLYLCLLHIRSKFNWIF